MLVEFALELLQSLGDQFDNDLLRSIGIDPSVRALDPPKYLILGVEPCPPEIGEDITSNVGFRVAKAIANVASADAEIFVDPVGVARKLMLRFPESHYRLSVGGRGYLNATPSPEFTKKVMNEFVNQGAGAFFSARSVFAEFERQIWNWNIDGALERLGEVKDKNSQTEIEMLITRSRSTDRLMLLTLLGDPEIDVSCYLRGLGGRQNTLWYLRRFFFDSQRYLASLEAARESERADLRDLFRLTEQKFCFFRHELFVAHRCDRPERVLHALLDIVRDFYRIFNDPRMRIPSAVPVSLELLRAYTDLGRNLVRLGLECLFGQTHKEFLQ